MFLFWSETCQVSGNDNTAYRPSLSLSILYISAYISITFIFQHAMVSFMCRLDHGFAGNASLKKERPEW